MEAYHSGWDHTIIHIVPVHTPWWSIMAGFELDILETLHKGRPKDEEPHVKRAVSKKGNDSGIEYIIRVDLVKCLKEE